MSPRWIETTDELADVLASLGSATLAVDTEADSLHHYPEKVCLVQVTANGTDLVIDPLADVDLTVLRGAFEDSRRRKVFHGADYDLRLLQRDSGLRIRGLFDTMVAARLTGERQFGLAALLASHFDVTLDKRLQRADWSRRPLSPEMLDYAAMDTRFLEALANRLEERLVTLGRESWAAEEFARLEEVRWDDRPDPEPFRRVKGSGSLDRRGLGVLRELHRLREDEALRRGRPPFRILRDEYLLTLSRALPRSRERLAELRLPRPWRDGGRARASLSAVSRATELAENDLPVILRRSRPPAAIETQVRRLCKTRDGVARELDLEPSLLAARAALTRLVEARVGGEDAWRASGLREWQIALIRPLVDG